MIRVLIADDHPIIRSGIASELLRYDDIQLIGEALNGDDALQKSIELQPDVLILDINMPGKKAVQVVRELRGIPKAPAVLILTAYGDPENVIGMLTAGARGFLLKDSDPGDIVVAVRMIYSGKAWISPMVAGALVESMTERKEGDIIQQLSSREMEILRYVAQGYSNTQVAEFMKISEGTVKNHVMNIYAKLNIHTRSELVAWAWKNDILRG